MYEETIGIEAVEQVISLFGNFDENIKTIENEFRVTIVSRGADIKIQGEPEMCLWPPAPYRHCFL